MGQSVDVQAFLGDTVVAADLTVQKPCGPLSPSASAMASTSVLAPTSVLARFPNNQADVHLSCTKKKVSEITWHRRTHVK